MTTFFRVCLALAPLALAACSEAPKAPKAPAAPVPKGIFISSNDCAETGKLTGDECGAAIDSALAMHEKQSKSYDTAKLCAAAEGADRCDKTVDGKFRPRLQAFLVTMSKPPKAEPLYPPAKKKRMVGFRSPTLPAIDASDEAFIVSASALRLAHQNSSLP
ncbi:MAG: DUF1190 domain-containing protein [Hyphomicrobium sp.]